MPRNGSGVYTLPAGNPVVPGTTIETAWANGTMNDIANELTNSLARNGSGGMTAPFKLFDGSVAAPGLAFTLEPSTGVFRESAGVMGLSVLATKVASFGQNDIRFIAPAANGTIGLQTNLVTWLLQGNTISAVGTVSGTLRNVGSIFGEDASGILNIAPTVSGPTTGFVRITGGNDGGRITLNGQTEGSNGGGVSIETDDLVGRIVMFQRGRNVLQFNSGATAADDYAAIVKIQLPNGTDGFPSLLGLNAQGIKFTSDGAMSLVTGSISRLGVDALGNLFAPGGQLSLGDTGGAGRIRIAGSSSAMTEFVIPGVIARGLYMASDKVLRYSVTDGSGGASTTQIQVTEQGAFNLGYAVASSQPAQLALVGLQGQSPQLAIFQNGIYQWNIGMIPNVSALYIGQGNSNGIADAIFAIDPTDRSFRPAFTANNANLGSAAIPYATVFASNPLTPSDRRLKEDIEDLDAGLDEVLALRPVTFRWKDRVHLGDRQRMGFIAQEVQAVLPLAVAEPANADDPLALSHTDLIAPLVAAVQSLHTRLLAVEAR